MNKYIYLLAVVFGLSGCNDFLELSPTNKVIETDYYKTQEDLTEALVAAYDPLKWNAYNAYSSYELVSNIMSDDAETGGSTVSDQPQLQRVNDFTNWVTPTNLPEGLWGRSYEGVNRANIVIEKCPLLPEGTMSEELRDRYVAEAHFLRVFYYFQLWRFFGYIPYYETNLGLDDITTVHNPVPPTRMGSFPRERMSSTMGVAFATYSAALHCSLGSATATMWWCRYRDESTYRFISE